jgi:uncharacterized protein YidB (DUF937 family)
MGLLDQVLGAVANPAQQGSMEQLGSIFNAVQSMSGNHGGGADATQAMLSVVGGYVRSSLREAGPDQAQTLVNQFGGGGANSQAVQALLTPVMQQQVVQDLIGRTGLDPQTIEGMLPTLIPLALQFLQTGAPVPNAAAGNAPAGNPVLNAFLDGDSDGDVDLGDALGMASKFLSNR